MKSIGVIILSIICLGIAIFLTVIFVRDSQFLGLIFSWIIALAVWAEGVNIIVHSNKKEDN